MKSIARIPLFALVCLPALHSAQAVDGKNVDGIAVSVTYKIPLAVGYEWSPEVYPRGKVVKYTVQSGVVTANDTLFHDLGQYPSISFDGTKLAFFKWGLRVDWDANAVVAGTESEPSYIHVMNIDGTNGTDLLQVDTISWWNIPDIYESREGSAVLDWPKGDYIYYEKPLKTAEIWRVKYNDASTNELVCAYTRDPDLIDPPTDSQYGLFFRRWEMSADAQWVGCQVKKYNGNENKAHRFPPPDGDILKSPEVCLLPGCNMGISASGTYVSHYLYAGHSNAFIYQWDHQVGSVNQAEIPMVSDAGYPQLSEWAGVDSVGANAEWIRFSVNSDKWFQRSIAWDANSNNYRQGSNQYLVNWKDSAAVVVSTNPAGSGLNSCTGDFWVNGGTEAAGKYEDVDGNWVIPQSVRNGLPRGRAWSQFDLGENGTVRLMDSRGRVISRARSVEQLQINTDAFGTGIYLLGFDNGKTMLVRKTAPGL